MNKSCVRKITHPLTKNHTVDLLLEVFHAECNDIKFPQTLLLVPGVQHSFHKLNCSLYKYN